MGGGGDGMGLCEFMKRHYVVLGYRPGEELLGAVSRGHQYE